jgi:hypothetical protein
MNEHADINKSINTLFETGLSLARYGFTVAGAAVGYASEILKDVSVELKAASERVSPEAHGEETPVAEAAAETEPKPAE